MRLKCKKKIFVKCIESVYMKETEIRAFTKDEVYEAFSWYSDSENCYNLTAIDNEYEEHKISDGIKDDMTEYLKNEWFVEHFEFVSA